MQLQLPRGLHYPITITELLKRPDDNVERFAPLFSYSYKTTVTEGNKFGDEFQVEKDFPTKFESSVGGKLKAWSISVGDVISRSGYVLELPKISNSMVLLTSGIVLTSLRSKSHAHMECSLVECAPSVDRI